MSDTEEVLEVPGQEKFKLVDCITDPELDWVAPEPRGIASVLTFDDHKLYTVVEQRRPNEPVNWTMRLAGDDERVCSSFDGHEFAMYEYVFKEMGFRLPFSPFAVSVLKALQVAPSQLHPNSWAFILAFEHLCVYKDVPLSLPLFFRIFKIQRKPTREEGRAPRQNWVSLKHHEDVKIFKMFVDSIKDFKERYYIIRPESDSARENLVDYEEEVDEQGAVRRDANGQVVIREVPKFPLSWTYTHFHKESKEYTIGDADLTPEDKAAFESLKAFVAGFVPGIWTTRKGVTITNARGEPMTSPRNINTRTLLKCKNAGEVKICLDKMESIAERILKAKKNEKASQSSKKKVESKAAQRTRSGTPSAQVIPHQVAGSGTPSSSIRPPPAKRTREEEPVEEVPTGMIGLEKFPVPRCFTVERFFEKYPPEVFAAERSAILNQEPEVRKQQHARDMAAVIRMVSSSLVLGDERDLLAGQVEAYQTRVDRLKGRINKLKADAEDYEEKKKHWGDKVEEHRKRGEELTAARAEIERLTAAMAPGEDEHAAAEGLTTRAELVKVIAQLSRDFVEGTEYAFKNAVQQIKLLNPEVDLVTQGMHVNGEVKDGQIVLPANLVLSDDEEDFGENEDQVHEQHDENFLVALFCQNFPRAGSNGAAVIVRARQVFEQVGVFVRARHVFVRASWELYKHLELFLSYANTGTLVYPSSQPEPPIASWVLGHGTGTMGSFQELSSSSRSSTSLMVN
ncbi:hypothetical protein L195_g004059 [Trifolium pratense]|uniref:Transposase (putative) gypsy type domain-containing protein n=1 Tax=Trifolium pratense TaxID=57577 RepID=A0A2K3NWZ7_TRIPR|nr:hypothetical protein L195_g004059 [Trifolium pratense]